MSSDPLPEAGVVKLHRTMWWKGRGDMGEIAFAHAE